MHLNDGTYCVVTRTMKSTGVGTAFLEVEDIIKAQGSAPVTAAVTELLGVDREGFMISVFARQFELDRLRSMDPTPRMQTVLRLLGINQITKAVKIVRDDGNEHRRSLEDLRGHQMDLEAVEDELRSLETDLVFLDEEIASEAVEVDVTKAVVADLDTQRLAIEPQRKAYQTYQNELQSRKTTLLFSQSAADQAKREADTPEPEKPKEPVIQSPGEVSVEEIETKKAAYLSALDSAQKVIAEHSQLSTQIGGLKDTCPTCQRPFDDAAHIERERKRMQDKIDSLVPIIENLKTRAQDGNGEWFAAIKAQEEWSRVNQQNASLEADFRMAYQQYELTMAHRAQAQERMARTAQELATAQAALDALKPVQDVSDQDATIRDRLMILNLALNEHTKRLATAQGARKNLDVEIKRVAATLKGQEERLAKTKKLTKTVEQHETTAAELQRLKEKLIGQIIPSLNERASALVNTMTDGKYDELSLTNDYEIEYRNPLGEYKNFLNLSGGEQTVFALALRLAISDLRAGNLGVMFLDEAISNLSSEDGRQESVWQAIESLTARFQQIFCITHVEAYKDRAPFTVRL
jgi:DNA repair exonuclease SbcCD ATPase subunit